MKDRKDCIINHVLRTIFFFMGFLMILKLLSAGFTSDRNSYTRISAYELQQEDKIACLWLGASRVYRGIDPGILDDALHAVTFNAGSSSQRPEDSYFLLKEILKHHQVEKVVYDINYIMFQDYPGDSTIRTHILLDYMSFGINKLQYAHEVLGKPEYGITTISNVVRYKEGWKDGKKVLHNIKMHFLDPSYKKCEYSMSNTGDEWYAGKGFVYSNRVYESGEYLQVPWSRENLYPRQLEYLQKMVSLCKEHGCDLLLISLPVYPSYLMREPHYLDIYDFFLDFSKKNGIEYVDLNQISLEELGITKESFQDEMHLNGKGAEEISRFLADYLLTREENEGTDFKQYGPIGVSSGWRSDFKKEKIN